MGQAPTVSIPKRWPLIAQPDNRDQTTLFDSKLVNAIAEKSVDGFQVEKRAGLSTTVAYALTGAGEGMFLWTASALNTILIMISGGTVYGVAPFLGYTNLYTIGTGIQGGYFYFCPVEAATPYLVFGAGNLIGGTPTYYITPSSSILQITDPNFPGTTVPGIVFLDGTTYVMDPSGGIWGSANLNDPTVWSALNVIYANAEADPAVFLAKQLVYVIALKAFTVQFFYDAGNTIGSPLAPVPGALLNIGCLSAGSVQVIDDLMFWVSSSKTATPRVVMMRNLQPTIISTPAVERTIAGDIQDTAYYSWTFRYGGHRLYGFTSYAANITWVFDIDEQLWYQWTDYLGNYYPIVSFAVNTNGQRIAQPLSGGNVYFADADYIYPNDSGNIFPVDIYTPNEDFKVDRRKMLSVMRFNADQTDGSSLMVRSSEDDYQTWSNFRRVDLSKQRPVLNGCGTFYRRAYHFRHLANTKFRIRSVDLQMDVGTL